MANNDFKLSIDSNILEVIKRYPHAVEIFIKYGLPCVGCAAARFEKISDAAAEFGIDGESIINEIKKSTEKGKNETEA